jgi:hypothetical protein
MDIYLLDTEFLSWSKKQSQNLEKRNSYEKPEIIQISIKKIFTKNSTSLNIFIKPNKYKNYPYRISKLTGIKKNYLDKNGINFDEALILFKNFVSKNSIIISNGYDNKIISQNIKFNKLNLVKKKRLFFLDLNNILYKYLFSKKILLKKKFIDTTNMKKIFNLEKIKNHNAENDVKIHYKILNKINFQKKNIKNYFNYFKVLYI